MNDEFINLTAIAADRSLAEEESRRAMELMADGAPSPDEIEAFLRTGALSVENVDAPTLTGLVKVVRERAVQVPDIDRTPLFDTCGTGGGASTFNISTAAALGIAAAGRCFPDSPEISRIAVAKHGNRAIASKSGSADVLERLGVQIQMAPAVAARAISEIGFGFLFAPGYHRAFSHVQPVRKKLAAEGLRTAFNFVGPLANPSRVTHQIVGIFLPSKLRVIAEVLRSLGLEAALCVAGSTENGEPLDEISICGPTRAILMRGDDMVELIFEPGDFGLPSAGIEAIRAVDCAASAEVIRRIIKGDAVGSPESHVVAMNIAAAIHIVTSKDMKECAAMAGEILESGEGAAVLERLVTFSGNCAT